jgi:hypothetical protein
VALVPLGLDGYPTPQDPVQRLVSIDVKSGVEKQLATLDPPPDSILAGRISLHPDGNRLAVSFVRQHGKIYMLEGFDESTSWFDRLMRRFQRAGTAVVRMVGDSEKAGCLRDQERQVRFSLGRSVAGLLKSGQLPGPFRQHFRSPDDNAVFEEKHSHRMETRVVEHDRFVGKSQSFRSAHQAPGVPAKNINVRNIVPSPRNPKADSLNMQFGVFQRNINEDNPVTRLPGFFHDRYCPMAGKSCFQGETHAGSE